MSEIYCHAEPGRFPDTEFARNNVGDLVVPLIHTRGTPHYSSGDPLFPGSDPTTANLLGRIYLNMLTKSKAALESEVRRLEGNP
jgi:hypothetical protein